jgi:hypothetical protein
LSVDFNKEKGTLAILDGAKKVRLVYSSPIVLLPYGKTITPNIEWDAPNSSLSVPLPDLSFPIVVAFGLSDKIPDVKGGFHLSFPSLKLGAKGEIEDSSSESDDEEKKKKGGFGFGIKAPKFGFGHKDKPEVAVEATAPKFGVVTVETPDVEMAESLPTVEVSADISIKKPKHKVCPLPLSLLPFCYFLY